MSSTRLMAACVAAALLAPAAAADPSKDESGRGRGHDVRAERWEDRAERREEIAERREDRAERQKERREEHWDDRGERWHDRAGGRDGFDDEWRPGDRTPAFDPWKRAESVIPKGHEPPPGECRTWIPGVPPGQQPPPYRC